MHETRGDVCKISMRHMLMCVWGLASVCAVYTGMLGVGVLLIVICCTGMGRVSGPGM